MIEGKFSNKYSLLDFNINLKLPGEGLIAVLGDSGSGKTTFLRCLAGLNKFKNSYLKVNGEFWQNETMFLAPYKRSLAYVFQDSALFSHLTVEGNLNYGRKRIKKIDSKIDYDFILEILSIEHLLKRDVLNLSGGEKQRVAMARALYCNPKLIVMDEPLSSLDSKLKADIIPYLLKLKELKIPIIYVTHAKEEIEKLADCIVCFKEGKVDKII